MSVPEGRKAADAGRVAAAFAFPGDPASAVERRRLQALLASRVACQSLQAVIASLSNRSNVNPVLFGLLVDWVSSGPDLWKREVSHLWRAACIGDSALAESALVSLGVYAASRSGTGGWDFAIPARADVCLDRWVIRGVGSGSVFSDGGRLSAKFGFDGGCLSVETEPGQRIRWSASAERGGLALRHEVPGTGGSVMVVPDVVLSPMFLPSHANSRFAPERVCADTAQSLERALALVERAAPAFHDWVLSVIREVSPLVSSPGSVGSTSSIWDFGSVGISFGAEIREFLVAEMLVHEASHQQFFLAKTWGPLVNGLDEAGYHSPMVDRTRPIEKILLAYHVLVNLLTFHADLESHVPAEDMPALASRRAALTSKLENVSAMVSRSAGLSPFGSALAAQLRIREVALAGCTMKSSR